MRGRCQENVGHEVQLRLLHPVKISSSLDFSTSSRVYIPVFSLIYNRILKDLIIMGQWTRVENSNEVFLRVTNHTGQAEKNLLGPTGIRTRDLRFTSPMLYQLSYRSSWELVAKSFGVFLSIDDLWTQDLIWDCFWELADHIVHTLLEGV